MSQLLESTYFWTALALVIFFGLIYWKGLSAIKQSLDARINRIRLELEEAENLKEEALATLQDYQRRQRNAIEQADQIITAAQAQAEHLKQEAQTKLEEILKRREAQAMDKIAQAEARALEEMRTLTINRVIQASTAILTAKLEGKNGEKAVDLAIADVKDKLH